MEHPDAAWPRARDQQARPGAAHTGAGSKAAPTVAALRSWHAARRQSLASWARRHSSTAVVVARLMVCSFYINLVAAELETWSHLRSEEERGRMRRWPGDDPPHPAFPYAVAFLLPVAVLTAANVLLPPLFAALLLAFTLQQDARIVWANARGVLLHGAHPTELLMKQLALIGAAALLLAHSVREQPRLRRITAGLLRVDDDDDGAGGRRRLSTARSVLLLLGRLLVSALLLYAGYSQMRRMRARAAAAKFVRAGEPTVHHFGRPDAHDNYWQLLQCLLALPLALGLRTRRVATLLVAMLLLEALLKWGWWGGGWPSWHMRQHYREHFFVNVAAAGALMLLQCFGAGDLAVDRLLAKQD